MADSFIQVPADSVGKRVDASSLDVGATTVHRQRIVLASDTGTATFAEILSVSAVAASHGLVVRPCTATVVVASGTINVNGGVAISGTAQVAIGTPFTVNNISATVTVVGIINISATASVILAAGTANFGTLNDISRTVQVAVGTPFTINNISAVVAVSGGVAISGTAAVAIATASFVTVRALNGELANPSAGAALTIKTVFASVTATSQTVVAAVASKQIRCLGYRIQAQGTVSARFIAGSSGANLSQVWSFQAREGTVVNAPFGAFEFQSSAGEGIAVSLSGAVTADISLVYIEV